MVSDEYKQLATKAIAKAKENNLIKDYSKWCDTKEAKEYALSNEEVDYYSKYSEPSKVIKGHYVFNNKSLKATLKDGRQGLVVLFDCNNDYINILFDDDAYAKSVPLEDIRIVETIYNLI